MQDLTEAGGAFCAASRIFSGSLKPHSSYAVWIPDTASVIGSMITRT